MSWAEHLFEKFSVRSRCAAPFPHHFIKPRHKRPAPVPRRCSVPSPSESPTHPPTHPPFVAHRTGRRCRAVGKRAASARLQPPHVPTGGLCAAADASPPGALDMPTQTCDAQAQGVCLDHCTGLRQRRAAAHSQSSAHATCPSSPGTRDAAVLVRGPRDLGPEPPPRPCVTVRRVVVSLRGPGQSPVLPFACCVGSLRSVGPCGRCSCWCRFRVHGAQSLVCRGCAGCGACRLCERSNSLQGMAQPLSHNCRHGISHS